MFTGVDIESVSRFASKESMNRRFLSRCFTTREVEYCLSKTDPAPHFAVRFAAKEAVIKALSGLNLAVNWDKIEIINRDDGRPYVHLHTSDKMSLSLNIDISLSHSETLAIAFVVVSAPFQ